VNNEPKTKMNDTMTATDMVTVQISHRNRGCGSHTTITDEPWAAALANIDGLATARDNATYRGVRFGRQRQGQLVTYLRIPLEILKSPEWAAILASGRGELSFSREYLDSILAASAKIDAAIASARPAVPTYRCAGGSDGCCARVTVRGGYCASCAHDNE
jgi:hypothetical protein